MIPKVIGRPVYSYYLATIGFWTYAFFSSWTGMQRLIDGPFPAWMITASIAATILSIIPVATVGLNHHMTMRGYFPLMRYSPTLRFTVFGAIAYTAFSIVGVIISLRSMAQIVHFTEVSMGYSHLGLYAFFTMVMFGSMYYIVPRLVGREWRYATLIKLHFWSSAYGVGLMVLMLLVGGFVQGLSMNDSSLSFIESTQSVLALSARPQSFRSSADRFAFHFRLSFWVDAFWSGPHRDCPDFLESDRTGGCASVKGLLPLFLGIFGTFAFSWIGLTFIPNFQIGHLDPQTDEDGTDVYPAPRSGMAERGRRVYAANGCVYCHTQQVRADYAGSDLERKWGERRSAPRDYIFDRPVLLGKMRIGPDLANVGHRAPVTDQNAPPPAATHFNCAWAPAAAASPATSGIASARDFTGAGFANNERSAGSCTKSNAIAKSFFA